MKKICISICFMLFVLLMIPESGIARDSYTFGIQANRKAIEVFGEGGFDMQPSTLYAGANGLYYEDKYSMLGVHAMVGNVIYPGLTGKLGFKGVGGEFKRSGRNNQTVLALAFSISGTYDLSDVIATHYIPIILHATFNLSPKPLSFNDTETFMEAVLAADWMFLENAAVTASFRYLDVDFDDWDRSHGSGYLGFKFIL